MIKKFKLQNQPDSSGLFIKVFNLSIFLMLLFPIHGLDLKTIMFYKSSVHIETNVKEEDSDNWELELICRWGELNKRDFGSNIAIDGTGNIYITGYTESYGAGSQDVFLLKYNTSGILQWNKTWGGPSNDRGTDVDIDSTGNIYITGASAGNVILLKYNSFGTLLWNEMWEGGQGTGIAICRMGNIYITGVSAGDVILLKYDTSGTLLWNETWGSSGWETGNDIIVGEGGSIYITGTIKEEYEFQEIILLKFDSSGKLNWDKLIPADKGGVANGITIDDLENIYITGQGHFHIGGGAFATTLFLDKYDSSGDIQWSRIWVNPSEPFYESWSYGNGIVLDDSEYIYITGYCRGALILLKYDSSGKKEWCERWGGGQGMGIGINDIGNIYIIGISTEDVILLELCEIAKSTFPAIPGYDIILILGMIGLLSAVHMQKSAKKKKLRNYQITIYQQD